MGLESGVSEIQELIIYKSCMIYKKDTVMRAWGEVKGKEIWEKSTVSDELVNEVVAMLGKGSGKNFTTSRIAVPYMVYLLLCLKDPAKYFGRPHGDFIDILNIATNADQASRTFFEPFKQQIKASPWFAGKIKDIRQRDIEFNKYVRCFSGHSQQESWEGFNLMCIVLDEIAAFNIDEEAGTSKKSKLNAEDMYNMAVESIGSRYSDVGKTILLSFPRYKGDFIQQRYDAIVAEKEVVIREHKYKLHNDVPDGDSDNEFTIQWEEDRIISYKIPNAWAIRRPSWEVNPVKKIEDYKVRFYNSPITALTKYACMPPIMIHGFFKDPDMIDEAFPPRPQPFTDGWVFADTFRPNEKFTYYVHVDLAQKKDRAAVALAHSPGFVRVPAIGYEHMAPRVIVDAVRWFEAENGKDIDFGEIRRYIYSLVERGFHIAMVTTDKWNSVDFQAQLRARGMEADTLSVGLKEYENLQFMIYDKRVHGYKIEILIDELKRLRQEGNKVDHPPGGSKDLADAVCGAVYHASKNAVFEDVPELDMAILDDSIKPEKPRTPKKPEVQKPEIPEDLAMWLEHAELL